MKVNAVMRRGVPAVVLAGLATVLVSAQNAPAPQQGTTFRATTNYVSTDVQVQDKDGRFVPGIAAEEFRVYEDGVPQKIVTFASVVGGRVFSVLRGEAAPAPVEEGLILPRQRPPTDTSGRIFIIFIDDLHFTRTDTPRVRQLLEDVRDNLVHENDLVGFVSSGPSSIEVNPVYDFGHRRFDEAIDKTVGSALTADEIVRDASLENSDGPQGLRYNVHTAFRTVFDMLEQLGQIKDRRKSFIYVSSGYSFDPFNESRYKRMAKAYEEIGSTNFDPGTDAEDTGDPDNPDSPAEKVKQSDLSPWDSLADPAYRRRTMFAETDLMLELAELVRDARRNNVVFYALDPRGVDPNFMDATTTENITSHDRSVWFQQTQGTLRVLSDETGGFCICNSNNIKPELQRIDNETSNYYIIGYVTNDPNPLRIRRQIKIEVTHPGAVNLVYRDSYTMPRPKGK